MSWSAGIDKVAQFFQNIVEPATSRVPSVGSVSEWAKKVLTVTWIEQPQNVYNLIAFACALVIIYVSIKYGKVQIK